MKNLKVSAKLIVSFLIVAVFTAIVGIVGIVALRSVDSEMDAMYAQQTLPIPDLAKVGELLQRQRACAREFIIGAALNDFALIEDAHSRSEEYEITILENMTSYRESIDSDEALAVFDEAAYLYNTVFLDFLELMYELSRSDEDPANLYVILGEYTPTVNKIVEGFDASLNMKIEAAAAANESSTRLSDAMLVLIIVTLVIALAIAMFLSQYVARLISRPLSVLAAFMKKAGTTGDITLSDEDKEIMDAYAEIKDEVGETIGAAEAFVERITQISDELAYISDGDLTRDINLLSHADVMGISLNKMIENLNNMFSEINSSASEVSTGSKQVAEGAQSLAQGSTEQAASVEELLASIATIAAQTKENSELAVKTASLAGAIKNNAEEGSRHMDDMIVAVNEINEAGQSISKVIKTIDDIAFQTNILALNAAVEAARAGQHGKGFAVVAEEVRNLAAKSAEAASDTGHLIENSIQKATIGVRIAGETAESLSEIVAGINESTELVSVIAQSSANQSIGIEQINTGIDQVAQVVQRNSATAQESAAASQQMSGQSDMLQQLISQFKVKDAVSTLKLPSHI